MTILGIGGGIGIGLRLPGLNISAGGGIGIGGGDKSDDPSGWVPEEVIKAAEYAVFKFNKDHGNDLKFQYVFKHSIRQIDVHTKEYTIELVAKDCLHRDLPFKTVVIEKINGSYTTLTPVSFEPIFY
ncbi:phloem filament protein [Cucumis melo var. makuwa]|uniref:Phloem filament protein n=1 Tax=Cucumis melo var. makuwa TaxID=1194695 RepID=A0A5D3C980_CUCMM|nr:phloem filament protein [Cucumis melo var. makuwa]